ncbi:MAG: putative peptidoglycan glycosyltransferase FtsW [Oscillospiraceae bacterium]|nr:putative peptidoglycan glycosyltransferase FtsW [Oscillospiraceae bacterium]
MAKNGQMLKKKRRRNLLFGEGGIDVWFVGIVLTLLTVGLIMLFSSSYTYCYYNFNGNSLFYFKRQLFFGIVGVIVMFAVSKINYQYFKMAAVPVLVVSFVLLVVVLFVSPPPGFEQFHRWITIPGIGTFQPSEISKFAIILFLAWDIDKNYRGINSNELSSAAFAEGFNNRPGKIKIYTKTVCLVEYAIIILLTCALIYKENHVSGTLLVLALGVMMLWLAGFNQKAFIAVAIIGVLAVALVVIKPDILPSHAQPRITAWLDKDYDPLGVRWQTNNALYAIGSGGFFGVGLGNSKQKQLYVSEPQNDFIFSIVCEELGFIGAFIIIVLFILLVWRGFVIGLHSKDKFGALLAMGIVLQVGLQAALNIGVVTDVLPNTGISLPFFSYGGTSLLMLLGEMGIVLSISRYSKIKKV